MIQFIWNMGQHEWCRAALYNEKWFRMWRIIYNVVFYTHKHTHRYIFDTYFTCTPEEKPNQTKYNTHTRTRTGYDLTLLLNYFVPFSPSDFFRQLKRQKNRVETCLPNRLTVLSSPVYVRFDLPFSTNEEQTNRADMSTNRTCSYTQVKWETISNCCWNLEAFQWIDPFSYSEE